MKSLDTNKTCCSSWCVDMHLFFLIPLATGLVSGYIFQKSADEMAYLSGIVALISLIFSLVLAPWQIQLLVLGGVIYTTRKLLLENRYRMQMGNNKEEKIN